MLNNLNYLFFLSFFFFLGEGMEVTFTIPFTIKFFFFFSYIFLHPFRFPYKKKLPLLFQLSHQQRFFIFSFFFHHFIHLYFMCIQSSYPLYFFPVIILSPLPSLPLPLYRPISSNSHSRSKLV